MVRLKGYDMQADGVPKTIKRHFEMLTSGGETVVATNYTEFGASDIIEVCTWLWSPLSILHGWVLLPRTSCTAFRNFERRRRPGRKAGEKRLVSWEQPFRTILR